MNFQLTDEQIDIRDAAKEFCDGHFTKELAIECDRREEFPRELHRRAAGLGFIGVHFPEEYGGQGYGYLENAILVEELCRGDSTLGTAIVLADLGCELILKFGTKEQKEKYVVRVAKGDSLSAAVFTEPARGSALSERLDTVAVREGLGWSVSGMKTLITNASTADFFITLCQTDAYAQPPYRGQSLLIVEGDAQGIEVTKLENKMGIRAAPIGEISFDKVHVLGENLIGGRDKGFYHTMEWFNESRVEVAAQALGIAQGAFDRALEYAKQREAFGIKISGFQAISHKLAEMRMKIEAARLLVYKAAWLIDHGGADPLMSSMAKTLAGRVAVEVADEAVQVLGGYGYMGEYEVERIYRDAKITEIYEGTSEIQKNTIARFLLRRN